MQELGLWARLLASKDDHFAIGGQRQCKVKRHIELSEMNPFLILCELFRFAAEHASPLYLGRGCR